MVMSRSGQRSHLVLPCKTRRLKCDSDCMNFKSLGICSHSVAVAELSNQLQAFITAFTKAKKTPSFTTVAVHGMPSGRGRKGSQAPRKRKHPQLITERDDLIAPKYGSKSSFSPAVSGSSNQTFNLHSPTHQFSYSSEGPWFMNPYMPTSYILHAYRCVLSVV